GASGRRRAAADPGNLVPIELTLRAKASLLAWPFFAVIPILLGASLGWDEEDPRPLFRKRPDQGGSARSLPGVDRQEAKNSAKTSTIGASSQLWFVAGTRVDRPSDT